VLFESDRSHGFRLFASGPTLYHAGKSGTE